MMYTSNALHAVEGPILIIGASGFIGANLLHACLAVRKDVVGTVFKGESWRLRDVHTEHIHFMNMQDMTTVRKVFAKVRPKTVFDCSSFGAYSFETDMDRIHATNYISLLHMLEFAATCDLSAYIHTGTSSEYGFNAAGPAECEELLPNSQYAVSKAAAAHAIAYYGKARAVPAVNLRLYSVYGPYEDSSRLFPALCIKAMENKLPHFADRTASHDFIFVDDVVEACIMAAAHIQPEHYGESFNIGTGIQTRFEDLAQIARELFAIADDPIFNPREVRAWDVPVWYSQPQKAATAWGWKARTPLAEGLTRTYAWWQAMLECHAPEKFTKKHAVTAQQSLSAVIACYKDAQAIPVMYQRLTTVCTELGLDYELIFVNDGSPDDTQSILRDISAQDARVIGITHSRNFGSQAAFRSGMEFSSKECCVLLDGDLQDPPEYIKEFVIQWRAGADVVYGRRVKRDMPVLLELCYKLFYKIFSAMSEVPIPQNAGDFSLLDHSVVHWMLQCQERDAFLRGLRAYVGFKQVGVDYVRPERMFGKSTNNWIKNIGWAKKAIFSFSRLPLHLLTAVGGLSCICSLLLALSSVIIRFWFPERAPHGFTYLSLLVIFFGSATLFGLGLLGEYIGKILEETKGRPPFIRKLIISRGIVSPADEQGTFHAP